MTPMKKSLYWTQWRCCIQRLNVAWRARCARSTVPVAASGSDVLDAGVLCALRVYVLGPPSSVITKQATSSLDKSDYCF